MGIESFVSAYSGALGDKIHNMLLANTDGTSATWTTNDLWLQFFFEHGYTLGTKADRERMFLLGYTGVADTGQTVNDLWSLITDPYTSVPREFANGEEGVAWRLNKLSTLFQDSAGTTPVTAVGQKVCLVQDVSGNGNHMIQATADSGPTLRRNAVTGAYYLESDGTNDWLNSAATIDFTATDKMGVFLGVTFRNNTAGMVLEFGPSVDTTGNSFAYSSNSGVPKYSLGGSALYEEGLASNPTKPDAHVAAMILDLAAASGALELIPHRNGGVVDPRTVVTGTTAGTGAFGNRTLYAFRRGGTSLPIACDCYGMTIIGRTPTAAEIASHKRRLAIMTGVQFA